MSADDEAQTIKGNRHGILSITIKDLNVLHSAFMPFVENGGLFIPTNKEYELDDEVFMLLTLMDDGEKIPVSGTVVWITPKQPQGNRAPGIGVQFKDNENDPKGKIENHLAGMLNSDKPTHTM